MDPKSLARFEACTRLMRALAHPSRLFMLEELAKGERCVCELTAMVGADMSTVSKHLSVLKLAGLVEDQKRGVQVFYRLRGGGVLGLLRQAEALLQQNLRQQMELMGAA